MKRLLFVFMAVLSLTACEFVADETESQPDLSGKIVTPDKVQVTSYSSSSYGQIFSIDPETSKITINSSENLGGKSVYYAVVNADSKKIDRELARYISEETSGARTAAVNNTYEPVIDEDDEGFAPIHDFFAPEFEEETSRSAILDSASEAKKLVLETGKTTSKFFVRTNSGYSKEKATLYAYNEICNIWILDADAFLATESQKKEIAEQYAEKFAEMYPVIRNVFGEESDSLYVSVSGRKGDMESLSATGTKVNIIVCDIGADGQDGNTIGLFSSMDYYKNGLKFSNTTVNRSNEGKFFYIDSFYASNCFDYTISTLAHEFQHMVNFGMKVMNGLSCDANLNEMLSMLCEDMMQAFLGIGDEFSPKNRIKTFIRRYYSTGIRNYDESLVAYANAYIFGAWLTRQFGGAALVKEMMTNKKSNNDCIAAAVSKMSGKTMSFNEVFGLFVKAVFNGDESVFMNDAEETLSYGSYTYPMKGFSTFDCPAIFENLAVSALPASYGVMFKKYGEIGSGKTSLDLSFASESGMTNSNVLVYVFIK